MHGSISPIRSYLRERGLLLPSWMIAMMTKRTNAKVGAAIAQVAAG